MFTWLFKWKLRWTVLSIEILTSFDYSYVIAMLSLSSLCLLYLTSERQLIVLLLPFVMVIQSHLATSLLNKQTCISPRNCIFDQWRKHGFGGSSKDFLIVVVFFFLGSADVTLNLLISKSIMYWLCWRDFSSTLQFYWFFSLWAQTIIKIKQWL